MAVAAVTVAGAMAAAAAPAVPVTAPAVGMGAPTAGSGRATQAATRGAGRVIAAYSLVAPKSVAKSQLVVRAVLRSGPCPTLDIRRGSGRARSLPMAVRQPAATTNGYFDSVVVCSRAVPAAAVSASVAGRVVPARMPSKARQIAIFADTGCRIAEYHGSYVVQDCNDPNDWPLSRVATSIAGDRPDVILNPGDYFYREADCPVGRYTWAAKACGGSPPVPVGMPFRDSSDGWLADMILPMRPIYPVAPILMLRGNHEACSRGGNGFFLFLDPRPTTVDECAPVRTTGGLEAPADAITPTWFSSVALAHGRRLRLAMVDSAYGSDARKSSWVDTQKPAYEAAAQGAVTSGKVETWLLTHRPIFGHNSGWLSVDQNAAAEGLLGGYSMILSSHIHLSQAIDIPGYPPNLVVGNSGTRLDPLPAPMTAPMTVGATSYPMPTTDISRAAFGYVTAVPGKKPGRWRLTQRDADGAAVSTCLLAPSGLTCR